MFVCMHIVSYNCTYVPHLVVLFDCVFLFTENLMMKIQVLIVIVCFNKLMMAGTSYYVTLSHLKSKGFQVLQM